MDELRTSGALQEAAIVDLRDLLLRAALYFFSRNLHDFEGLGRDEILQRAEDCAQEALVAVLDHLEEFRGDSKFTTWVYKFAINMAMVAARRERWKRVALDEVPVAGELRFNAWVTQDLAASFAPEQSALQVEIREILLEVIEHDLTENQRRVLVMMVFEEIPMDVVVQRLGTNRNAIYKMLHDARRKLKERLQAHGFEVGEILSLFAEHR